MKVPLIDKLPAVTFPRVYKLSPLTTPVAVIFLDDKISSSAITLPPLTLPDTFTVGNKVSLTVTLPALTLPRVYILPPLRSLVAVTFPEDTTSSLANTFPTLALPRVYKLLPLTTPVALTFPEDIISLSVIILPLLTLPDAVKMSGSKVPLIDKLPAVTFPRVYKLSHVSSLVAVTFPEDITSSVAITLPTFALPRV